MSRLVPIVPKIAQEVGCGWGVHIYIQEVTEISGQIRGKLFYLQLELFCLQLSFFAYSRLRPLLDALSHCKQKSSKCE